MKKYKYLFILFFIFGLFLGFSFLYNNFVSNKLLSYSKVKINNIMDIVINNCINEELLNKIDIDKLFITDNHIINIDNNISNYMTNLINDSLKLKMDIISNRKYSLLNIDSNYFYVNSSILFNTDSIDSGFSIPINIFVLGDPVSRIDLDVKEYGINNSVVSLRVNINIMIKIKLLLSSDYYSIEKSVVIGNKILEGEIPSIIRE